MLDIFTLHAQALASGDFDLAATQERQNGTCILASFTALIHAETRQVLMVRLGDYARGKLGGNPWTLPGGKVEAGETPAAGACREVREETGVVLAPKNLRLVAWFFRPYLRTNAHEGELISLFAAVAENPKPVTIAPGEISAAAYQTFDYREWLNVPETGEHEHPLQPLRRHWIYWTYLSFQCLSQADWQPVAWTYENAAAMRLPPWDS